MLRERIEQAINFLEDKVEDGKDVFVFKTPNEEKIAEAMMMTPDEEIAVMRHFTNVRGRPFPQKLVQSVYIIQAAFVVPEGEQYDITDFAKLFKPGAYGLFFKFMISAYKVCGMDKNTEAEEIVEGIMAGNSEQPKA